VERFDVRGGTRLAEALASDQRARRQIVERSIRWKSVAAVAAAASIIGMGAAADDDKPAPAPTAAPSAAPSPAPSPETSPAGPAPIEITSFVDTYYSYYKRKNEVDAIRLRPHPWEFALYFDA
jgi:hypothetical protein